MLDCEEDMLQTATADVAQLAGENVILWSQYLEMATLNDKVTLQLAKEHHNARVGVSTSNNEISNIEKKKYILFNNNSLFQNYIINIYSVSG